MSTVVTFARSFVLVPSDSIDLGDLPQGGPFRTVPDAVFISGAGAIACVAGDGTVTTIPAVPAGKILPLKLRRINATGTTATGIVGLYDASGQFQAESGLLGTPQTYTAIQTFAAGGLFSDGTAPLPAIAFTSETTLGFWRSAAGTITAQGALTVSGVLTPNAVISMGGTGTTAEIRALNAILTPAATGRLDLDSSNRATGSTLKVDALPTVSSGFGTSPSITAGSTPFAGSVNVGTGGAATSGVISFGGVAFPAAPFVNVTPSLTNAVIRASCSTTQLTITCTTAFTASDIISWMCVSSRA